MKDLAHSIIISCLPSNDANLFFFERGVSLDKVDVIDQMHGHEFDEDACTLMPSEIHNR